MKKNKIDVDMLLKRSLKSSETPDSALLEKVKYENFEEEPIMKQTTRRRSLATAAAAVITILAFSTTAFAAWYFLKPSQVADNLSDKSLSAAFESNSAININESVTSGGYVFTLLAIVSGKDITDNPIYNESGEILNDRTYTVVAVQKADGSPMLGGKDEASEIPSLYMSPYIKGLKPWQVNAHTLDGGFTETVVDGILYRIINCNEVTMFADRGIYLGINTGSFYNSEAFLFDSQTGVLTANKNFDGVSVVFDLPINKSLADPDKAEKYLASLSLYDSNNAQGDGGGAGFSTKEMEDEGSDKGTVSKAGTKKVMNYEEFKDWIEKKLAETQKLVDQGKYSKESMEFDRRDYESYLKDLKNGATLTLVEYEDGGHFIHVIFPGNEEYSVEIDPIDSEGRIIDIK